MCCSTHVIVKSIYLNSFLQITLRLNVLYLSELNSVLSPPAPLAVGIGPTSRPRLGIIFAYCEIRHRLHLGIMRDNLGAPSFIQPVLIVYLQCTLMLGNRNREVTNLNFLVATLKMVKLILMFYFTHYSKYHFNILST